MDRELAKEVAQALNSDGYVTDEQDFPTATIGTYAFKAGWSEFAKEVTAAGYSGGDLDRVGKFFPGRGNVYAAYDSDLMTNPEALAALIGWARKNPVE